MSSRTTEEIQAAIEELLAEWMTVDRKEPVIITGYVIKIRGTAMEAGTTSSAWLVPETQDVIVSLGLASALEIDVQENYAAAEIEDEDDV